MGENFSAFLLSDLSINFSRYLFQDYLYTMNLMEIKSIVAIRNKSCFYLRHLEFPHG